MSERPCVKATHVHYNYSRPVTRAFIAHHNYGTQDFFKMNQSVEMKLRVNSAEPGVFEARGGGEGGVCRGLSVASILC